MTSNIQNTETTVRKLPALFPWVLAGLVTITGFGQLFYIQGQYLNAQSTGADMLMDITFGGLLPLIFSSLAALIMARRPGNRVGSLMMLTAIGAASPISAYLARFTTPPAHLTPGLWLLLWLDNYGWLVLIFPIFLIPLYFPNGRLPSPRWRWVSQLAISLAIFFPLMGVWIEEIGPISEAWLMPNPIGFIPLRFFNDGFLVIWGFLLLTVIGGSVTSLFIRFRRAGPVERDQIKWLMFAGAFFFVTYGLAFFLNDNFESASITILLMLLSLFLMPIAIAVAILRYRLYDINLIIRRTLQYSLLTGLLALTYFGGIILLQQISFGITGRSDSPLVTVVTTLAIAALFSPLRSRVQDFIDRRFYRTKYDAELALAQFAQTARDEVDIERLTASILTVVSQAVHPTQSSLWFRDSARIEENRNKN